VAGDVYDHRIDLYALGVVLFEVLAGRTPFEGTFSEVVGKHLFTEAPSLESVGIRVPDSLERVLRHALAKDPAERISSAAGFVRELAEAAGVSADAISSLLGAIPEPSLPTSRLMPEALRPAYAPVALHESLLGSPEAFLTNRDHVADGHAAEGPPVPTVFVPTMPEALLRPGRPTGPMATRDTVATLAAPNSSRRWMAPAALGLAGFLVFGGATIVARNDVPPPAQPPAPEVRQPQLPEPARATETLAKPPSATVRPKERSPEAPSRDAEAEPQRAQPVARRAPARRSRARSGNPARKIGRALRVDRHIRKLF
jgi:serine/threonine-protein kinase